MSLEVNGMLDVLKKLDKLSDRSQVEGIAKKAVAAAEPINEAAMRSAIASSEYGPYSTGEVSASVSSTDVTVNEWGVYAVAKPGGRDRKGVRNGERAAYLEYGTSRMPARPWRARAVAAATGPCVEVMKGIVESEMGCEP